MRFPQRLCVGRFLRRDNRFRVSVEIGGRAVAAHLPNSGRLSELLVPGTTVWLTAADSPTRRTAFDLALVRYGRELVSVDARLPNNLIHEAILNGEVPELESWERVSREVSAGGSRFDFLLEGTRGRCWLEAKSVTLVEDSVSMFPDAPTQRGQRHVRHLQALASEGDQAVIVFVIQRSDAREFRPHQSADPAFTSALLEANQNGVSVLAYGCQVDLDGVVLSKPVPVVLSAN